MCHRDAIERRKTHSLFKSIFKSGHAWTLFFAKRGYSPNHTSRTPRHASHDCSPAPTLSPSIIFFSSAISARMCCTA